MYTTYHIIVKSVRAPSRHSKHTYLKPFIQFNITQSGNYVIVLLLRVRANYASISPTRYRVDVLLHAVLEGAGYTGT